jgi:uncharacterized protein
MTLHGLNPDHIQTIKALLRPYADTIETVGLFGSRATGSYRNNSDIDMVLYGSLTESTVDRLHTVFSESLLPMRVDVKAYSLVDYPPLKAHIDSVMYPLLHRADLLTA